MQYKIEYTLQQNKKEKNHCRFYHALTSSSAKDMFEATCSAGSLTGENVELKAIYRKKQGNWEKVKS
jgi:hypothetical protein